MPYAPNLKGKRVAILVDQLYQELEVWYPYYRLIEAGAKVDLVGAESGKTYPSKLGYPATTVRAYAELDTRDYDGVVTPGGYAPDFIRRYEAANEFVAAIHHQGKLVAAICHGLWCCVSADILRGKRCTSFYAIRKDVENAGGLWEDREVVIDGNLVSSRKPDDLPAFLRAAIDVLAAQ
jgi:protease I